MFQLLLSAALLASTDGAQPPQSQGPDRASRGNIAAFAWQAPTPIRRAARDEARPRMPGSPTGYVDDAVVSSKVRLRFDASFGMNRPDRAEFFYGKCGCFRGLPISQGGDPDAPGPGPGIVSRLNYQELFLNIEYAPTRRFALLAEVPFRSLQIKAADAPGMGGTRRGISDVRAGVRFAMLASEQRYLTAQIRTYSPTGSALDGLGTNHVSLEPSIIYYQRVGDRASVSGQLGGWIPISSSAGVPITSPDKFGGDVVIYGAGASYDAVRRPGFRVSPVLELVGWSVRSGLETTPTGPVPAGSTNIVNGKLGARVGFGEGSSVYIGYGRVITGPRWYRDVFRLEYRYMF
jgi:hypothetical protein